MQNLGESGKEPPPPTLQKNMYVSHIKEMMMKRLFLSLVALTSMTFVPVEGMALTVAFTTAPTTCSGTATGTIHGTITGGTPPYTVTSSPSAGTITVSGDTFTTTTAPAGTYIVTVADSTATVSEMVTVNQPDPFQPTIVVTNATCNAEADGAITVTSARGGTGDLFYSVDGMTPIPVGTSYAIPSLTAGPHTVTISDSQTPPCTESFQIFVGEPADPQITNVKTTNATSGLSNGAIEIGAQSNSSLQYSIDGGTTFQLSPKFNCLAAGMYSLVVQTQPACGTGCAVGCAIVNSVAPLAITATTTPCSITATVTGGTPPYRFAIDNCPFREIMEVCPPQSANVFTFTCLTDDSTHTISIVDADKHMTCISVNIPPLPGSSLAQFIQREYCPCAVTCPSPCLSNACSVGTCNNTCQTNSRGGSCPNGVCPTNS